MTALEILNTNIDTMPEVIAKSMRTHRDQLLARLPLDLLFQPINQMCSDYGKMTPEQQSDILDFYLSGRAQARTEELQRQADSPLILPSQRIG